jgi:uncharacterized membrane protein (DUF4010 family)
MSKHFLVNLKAYASLAGSVLTAVSTEFHSPIITVAVAVCAAIVVWRVPNADA